MSRLTSFRRALALTLCTGVLAGAGLTFAARPAHAGIEEGNFKCKSPSACDAGSYTCFVLCGGSDCACTIA